MLLRHADASKHAESTAKFSKVLQHSEMVLLQCLVLQGMYVRRYIYVKKLQSSAVSPSILSG